MKKSLMMIGVLLLFLVGCSQNVMNKSLVVNSTPQLLFSNSDIFVEPLAGKKVKISIMAKDESLYLINCNQTIMYSIFDAKTHKPASNNGYYTCRSDDIIVPKGMTLTAIKDSDDLASNLSFNNTYYL